MTGAFLKTWMAEKGKRPEEIAVALGVSANTVSRWYKQDKLAKRTVLALAQLGCVDSKGAEGSRATG